MRRARGQVAVHAGTEPAGQVIPDQQPEQWVEVDLNAQRRAPDAARPAGGMTAAGGMSDAGGMTDAGGRQSEGGALGSGGAVGGTEAGGGIDVPGAGGRVPPGEIDFEDNSPL